MADKIQRKINKVIRFYNKAWTKDTLLNGRFIIRQVQAAKVDDVNYYRFNITDAETGDSKETHWYNQYEFIGGYIPFTMFNSFNDFIIKQLYKY